VEKDRMPIASKRYWTRVAIAGVALVSVLTSSCTGATSEFVSSLFDGNKREVLEEQALQYMIDNYGDHFALSEDRSHSTSGNSDGTTRYMYFTDLDHPYDDVEVVSPGSDDGKGETLLTSYPYYLFGNEAAMEWEQLLANEVQEMSYLPPLWKWSDNEGDGKTTWGENIGGLTKDSSVQDFMKTAPMYGVLAIPVDGGNKYTDEQIYKTIESTWVALAQVDDQYDMELYVAFIKREAYDELAAKGDPMEELGKELNNGDYEFIQEGPAIIFRISDEDKRILAVVNYSRKDGVRYHGEWRGIEERVFDWE
jgi:hypothetical protein